MSHDPNMSAEDMIALLGLRPHPEGGHFLETFRDEMGDGIRSHSTAIYYLLKAGEVSHWHRVDATEVWHWYAGSPLLLTIAAHLDEKGPRESATLRLGPGIAQGERPQIVVPTRYWQTARAPEGWTLAGCTVAPGFSYSGFKMAPAHWSRPD